MAYRLQPLLNALIKACLSVVPLLKPMKRSTLEFSLVSSFSIWYIPLSVAKAELIIAFLIFDEPRRDLISERWLVFVKLLNISLI